MIIGVLVFIMYCYVEIEVNIKKRVIQNLIDKQDLYYYNDTFITSKEDLYLKYFSKYN